MDEADRDALGRMAYAVFRRHKPDYPAWDDIDESCREANRAAAEILYNNGRLYERSNAESEAE